eukprot:GSChrysophyteH1.ASY1.ANO1.728.1 assembled CDS
MLCTFGFGVGVRVVARGVAGVFPRVGGVHQGQQRLYSGSVLLAKQHNRDEGCTVGSGRQQYDISSAKNFDAFLEKKDKIDEHVPIGRSWTAADLRRKSFDDLHKLWFILYKERNMLLSERAKMQRMQTPVSPLDESRYVKVKRSMGAIKHVLRERSTIKRELELQNYIAEHHLDSEHETSATGTGAVRPLADTKPGGVSR